MNAVEIFITMFTSTVFGFFLGRSLHTVLHIEAKEEDTMWIRSRA